ncbi:hypothetical protein [Amycolatopsis vancoresmycina]|uniref:Guanylate cyclase domain-containing protein n=1 Tax=Amycolatopsis vancoresmycina DSM 44592 TaxID=1292037 RepID=R1I2C0_9PSEU|nr:hypothetical protein [Amycolatopsis vancoresmycina]EOD66686.1 hypothetical protein H480_20339 [Amycolatopsis vancoresmycina DSM 44592]
MIADGKPDEWPLGPAERVELVSADPALRGPGEDRAVLSAITFYEPRAQAAGGHGATAAPPGKRLIELHYGVGLDVLPAGTAYRSAEVSVNFSDDCWVVAAPDVPEAEHDIGGRRFRHFLGEPAGGRTVRTRLIVEIPAGRTGLTASMTCAVNLKRSVGARWHRVPAVAAKETSYTIDVSGHHNGSAVRLFLAADLVGFGQRDPQGSGRVQRSLADVLDRATKATGIAPDDRQEQGDGLQLAFPPAIDERAVLRAFHLELVAALREHNRDRKPGGALRLRVGIDRGLSDRNSMGWDRAAPTAAARLRDCAQARAAIATTGAPLVLVVSDPLYRDIFRDPDHEPPGHAFTGIAVDDPRTGFSAKAWLHVDRG